MIPNLATNPARWELTFTTTHDENHNFTIDFIDDEPQGLSIELESRGAAHIIERFLECIEPVRILFFGKQLYLNRR